MNGGSRFKGVLRPAGARRRAFTLIELLGVISVIALLLGLLLLVFMDGLYGGYDEAVFANAVRLYGGNLQIHAPGFRDRAHRLPLLPLEDPDQVVQTAIAHPEVLLASKRIRTSGMIKERGEIYPVTITGIQPSVEAPISLIAENITEGRYLDPADEDAILIGRELADLLGAQVGGRQGLEHRLVEQAAHLHGLAGALEQLDKAFVAHRHRDGHSDQQPAQDQLGIGMDSEQRTHG